MAKIVFVCPEYHPVPPIEGGAVETWIENMAQRLKGHEVYVCSIYRDALKECRQRGHVRYLYFKKGLLSKLILCTYKLPFKKEDSSLFFLPYSLSFALKLRKVKPDIIHIHNRPQFVRIFKWLNPKAKIVLHIHQVSAMEEKNLWTYKFLNRVDLFLGCSRFLSEEIKRRFPKIQNKIGHVYNGVDLHQFEPWWKNTELRDALRQKHGLEGKRVLLYVGRLAENKGADILITAVRNLVMKGHKDLRLFICGARGYSSQDVSPFMRQLFETADQVKENVIFTEYVPHEQIHEYYLMADLVVIPSKVEEGFCVVTIEAMASGLPLMAFVKGALSEIIRDRVDGILINEGDVDHLEKELSIFLSLPDGYTAFGRHGRKRVEETFTWNHIHEALEEIYKGLMENA
ncbi:MAG TPA: hypothetical protein DD723_09145 [Candidatus Omnitrophica bacterium]|nr:MAG: hypothetical protein A2Z81_08745 [Omnitrophica WOR_2 bacterium GWA2_45_18]OGX18990.1 MAG: hypothetical protein A2Y04_04750 [Omnitrophica WOR_2 bacterium GWC2_45_7]HBR15682.1 hypothetical protein [Candidatus Omnitrophota bacterium]